MAATNKRLTTEQIYAAPVENILKLTLVANKICSAGENSYQIRNALIIEEKKKQIRYLNGETLPNE